VLRTLARPRELARALPWAAPSLAAHEQARTALLASFALREARGHSARPRGAPWLATSLVLATATLLVWHLAPRPAPSRAPAASVATARPPRSSTTTAAPTTAVAVTPAKEARFRAEPRKTSVRTEVASERYELTATPTPAEAAFVEGWSAFRAARYARAIEAFGDASRLDPAGPLAEDARYWRAVALTRARAPSAPDELAAFLRRHPHSAHAAEAARLLETTRRPR
jgi:TolA-binding protein